MIRRLERADYDEWLPLWQSYLRFYRAELAAETTSRTFERLVTEADGFAGLVAKDADSGVVGFAHLIFHPSTWAVGPYCYLEDLFVAQTARGTSTASALIRATYDEADRRGAVRTYWHTQQYNSAARSLYDVVAHPTSFVVYERN